jgi:hypothetical protein
LDASSLRQNLELADSISAWDYRSSYKSRLFLGLGTLKNMGRVSRPSDLMVIPVFTN